MRTSTEPLEGNSVKLTVEVDAEILKDAEEETLRHLTKEARVPGFRPGKVPRNLLVARLGPKAIRSETLRDLIPKLYSEAVVAEDIDAIDLPKIEVLEGEESGDLKFDAVVEVRPIVTIDGYQDIVVTIANPLPTDDEIETQVDRLRDQFAVLNDVERPAADGDVLTLDITGQRDGKAVDGLVVEDFAYQIGSGAISEVLDEKLIGVLAGQSLVVEDKDAPGGPVTLDVTVKLLREKVLPDPDDELAKDASEFETMAELREDLIARLSKAKRRGASAEFQAGAIEALAALVDVELPYTLVREATEHLVHQFDQRLERLRIPVADYLATTGESEESVLASMADQAARQVRADLGLRALAVAESIVVEESDLDEEIVRLAAQVQQSPAEIRAYLERDERISALRSDVSNSKALAWLLQHVGIVDGEGRPVDRSILETELETDVSQNAGEED